MKKLLFAVIAAVAFNMAGAADAPALPQGGSINGVVLEAKDVDIYTYLRLRTKDGEIWAAVGKVPVKKNAEVTIINAMVMTNFESKTLKKTFDRIIFGTLADSGASGDLAQMHRGVASAVDPGDIKVAKASGPDGRTIAEVVGRKAELKGRSVAVRGKVVKYNPAIMGKNWVHLRDGSGSAKDETNDILVTTMDPAQVGSVVQARGVVRTDVDLGSGYKYKVLIEDARLEK